MAKSKERIVLACREAAKALFAQFRGYRMPEGKFLGFKINTALTGKRINLVLPALSTKQMFGGNSTAVRLFRAIAGQVQQARIIVVEESERQLESSRWPDWVLASQDPHARHTIAFLDRGSTILEMAPEDIFIATQWQTAYQIKHWMSALGAQFPARDTRFIYLIQDFEPAFYPWSSYYLMADSTYLDGGKIVAIFNTELLRSYFRGQGYSFQGEYSFEPNMSEELTRFRDQMGAVPKERLILIYGRPSVHRNAFELIIEALHEWSESFPGAAQWRVISLGERHKQIGLSNGVKVNSLGKVSLAQYASLMSRASIGVSLMVSPHPSYPPLEMADFGMSVITNSFAGKSFAARSKNILPVADASPLGIAQALQGLCEKTQVGIARELAHEKSAFLGAAEEFPFLAALLADVGINSPILQPCHSSVGCAG
jgi:hypothetical protein